MAPGERLRTLPNRFLQVGHAKIVFYRLGMKRTGRFRTKRAPVAGRGPTLSQICRLTEHSTGNIFMWLPIETMDNGERHERRTDC